MLEFHQISFLEGGKGMIRIQVQWGRGGLVVHNAVSYVSTIDQVWDVCAKLVRNMEEPGITMLSMNIEVLKDWEVKELLKDWERQRNEIFQTR